MKVVRLSDYREPADQIMCNLRLYGESPLQPALDERGEYVWDVDEHDLALWYERRERRR